MDFNIIELASSFGGVALLAVLIFFAFQSLVKQMRKDRMFMEDRLTHLIDRYDETCKKNTDSYIEHTKVLTELTSVLKGMNGYHR